MKSFGIKYVLILAVVLLCSSAQADTTFVGDVWGAWNPAFGTIHITGDIRVPPESTLTILAGVEVVFDSTFKMLVDTSASLYVNGEEGDSVTFTPASEIYKWKGIKFYESSPTSIIKYAKIEKSNSSGIDIYRSNITIQNCNIQFNENPLNQGGGVKCQDSDVYIANNRFYKNSSQFGGGLYCSAGDIVVNYNVFWQNRSPDGGWGGGVYLYNIDTSGTFSYNLIIDNTTTITGLKGGGLVLSSCNLRVFNNTVYQNFATIGGGIMLAGGTLSPLTNNIFWDNAADVDPEISWDEFSEPDSNQITYSDIFLEDSTMIWQGVGNINQDPLFVEPDPDTGVTYMGNFNLSWASVQNDSSNISPCIDAGDPDPVFGDKKDPDSSRIDMGALFYFHPFHLLGELADTTFDDSTLNPYYIMAPCTVPAGASLTFLPGVRVEAKFSTTDSINFDIYGIDIEANATLTAIASPDSMIVFTAFDTSVGWRGFEFDGANPACTLSSVVIEYAKSSAIELLNGSDIRLFNSILRYNSSPDSGGAIRSFASSPEIYSTIFADNRSDNDGGGLFFSGGAPKLNENSFVGNEASASGGGVYIDGGASGTVLRRNIFWQNISGNSGGALYCSDLTPDPDSPSNNTYYENVANNRGGGIFATANSAFDIKNSIFWDNVAFYPIGRHVDTSNATITVTYCDISPGIWLEDDSTNIHEDPMFVDPEAGDLDLQQGSPCINAGDPSSPDDPDSTRTDMGARYYYLGRVELCGPISWDTLYADTGIYRVTCDVSVQGGDTLTIEPGVTLNFVGGSKMVIDSGATLNCIGELSNSIRFTSFDTAVGWGGLIFGGGSVGEMRHTLFEYADSTAITIINNDGVVLDSNIFQFNSGYYGPGAVEVIGGAPQITYNLFHVNFSDSSSGGALLLTGDTEALVARNVFWENSAFEMGGAIACNSNAGDSLRIYNNTLYNNRANVGGGIGIVNSLPRVINNILWDDTAHFEPELYVDTSAVEISYCDIMGGWPFDTTNIDTDPLFEDADNGDFQITWANFPDEDSSKSPCIDAGDPDFPKDPDSTFADIGVYYYDQGLVEACDFVPGDINGDEQVLGGDVTYGVRYFKGIGEQPPDSCFNDSSGTWLYSAGDANGNCHFTGSDITFLVAYFKGNNPLILWCSQTPPTQFLRSTSRRIERQD